MTPYRSPVRWADIGWLLFWGCVSTLWCLHTASQMSATFDEPFYIQAGLERWHTGSHALLMKAGTMPLPIDVETLPIFLWEKARGQVFDPSADLHRILPWARAMNLLFWWTLLIYGWRLARLFGDPWAGRIAVVLLACEPNLLAHASLATTDISLTAAMLLLIYHFAVGRERSWGLRVGVPALCYGLALLAKASALAFGPLCMLVVEWQYLAESGRLQPTGSAGVWRRLQHLWEATRPLRRDGLQIVGLGLVVLFVGCGCDWRPQNSFVTWAHGLPAGEGHNVMVWTSEHLCIFSNAGEGLARQFKHNLQGHGAFILGQWNRVAIWYYYPVVLAIKLSVPTLGLLALLLLCKPRALVTVLGGCALLLLVFSLNCRVQIGIRLVFPLVALLLTSLAVGIARWQPVAWPGWARGGIVLGIAALAVLPVLARSPNGISYTNILWSGTDPDQLVGEANYDWGQGLNELADWQHRHEGLSVEVWYFGTDPDVNQPPFHHLPVHARPLQSTEEFETLVKGHYLAVSTTIFAYHKQLTPSTLIAIDALKRRQPVDRTTTFLIYDFTRD
jgi:hypothetical protein